MKSKVPSRKAAHSTRVHSKRRRTALAIAVGGAVAAASIAIVLITRRDRPESDAKLKPWPITFHRDVAPIIYSQCAPCHRPGQAAPFNLLSFSDVEKRGETIREVVRKRIMPPWLPSHTDGPFVGQRALSEESISIIERWVAQGMPEGSSADAVAAPIWNKDWELGEPDFVIRMAEAYELAAEGSDIYRNFVIPIPTTSRRYVRGIELRPANARVVHHAFMRIDATSESRRRDEQEPGPGFGGLHTPQSAQTPPGQFLSWQPGKVHKFVPPGLSWTLDTNCDLVLQAHLRPTGKPERLQASVAFYFTDDPPTNTPFKIGIRTLDIDIPAGASAHPVRESYVLSADVDVLSVLPHAHYLGKHLRAYATLPDGRRQSLLNIPRWDFNWQGDYRFERPLFLPKGAVIEMDYVYDNSTNNVSNPNQPPQRVRYGLQSSDEMAELWLQVLLRRTNELPAMARYDQPRVVRESIAYNEYLLRLNPNDPRAHSELGKALLFSSRFAPAEAALRRALEIDPAQDEPHYFLGLLYRMQNKPKEAEQEFTAAVRVNPGNAKAQGNLGLVLLSQGEFDKAESHLREALRLNPADEIARKTLEELAKSRATTPRN